MLVSGSHQYECYSCWDYEGSFVLAPSDKGFKKLVKGRYYLILTVQWPEEVDESSRKIRLVVNSPVSFSPEIETSQNCVSLLRSVLMKHADSKQDHSCNLHPLPGSPFGFISITNQSETPCDFEGHLTIDKGGVVVLSEAFADGLIKVQLGKQESNLFVVQSDQETRIEFKGVFSAQRSKLATLLESMQKHSKAVDIDGYDAVLKTYQETHDLIIFVDNKGD